MVSGNRDLEPPKQRRTSPGAPAVRPAPGPAFGAGARAGGSARMGAASAGPGVTGEGRDDRSSVDVRMPFLVEIDDTVLKGVALSLEGLFVEGHYGSSLDRRPRSIVLKIDLDGYFLDLTAAAAPMGTEDVGGLRVSFLQFTSLGERQRDVLRRVMRAYLAGHVASPDDLIRRMDPATFRRGAGGKAAAARRGGRARNLANLVTSSLSLLVLTIVLVLSLLAIYDRFTVVRSRFAAVTAPRIDILSPSSGQVILTPATLGRRVERDTELGQIKSEALEADLLRARARLAALVSGLERDPARARQALSASGAIDPVTGPGIGVGLGALPADTSLLEEQAYLARANLAALELQISSNTLYAPCTCDVAWSQEDRSYVDVGDRIMTLARTRASDLKVEALISLTDAPALRRGQTAYVTWPDRNLTLEARVDFVTLDAEKRPRVGLPNWLRQDESVTSVVLTTTSPLSAEMIGVPARVKIPTGVGKLVSGPS